MKKSPKERRNQYVQAQRITTVEAAIAVKALPTMTISAMMPPYPYTSLCPDPVLRVAKFVLELRRRKRG